MKVGTLIFTVILLLVGFGYLASTCLDQLQEIQDLRRAIEDLNRQLQDCQQQQTTIRSEYDQAQNRIASRDATIEQLGAELQDREGVLQALQAEKTVLQSNLIELDRLCRAEIDQQKARCERSNQCHAISPPAASSPGAGDRQVDTLENSLLGITALVEPLGVPPQQLAACALLVVILAAGCGALLAYLLVWITSSFRASAINQ